MNQISIAEKLHFKLLAPSSIDVPNKFRKTVIDSRLHQSLIHGVQSVRGLALRECGSPDAHLLPDGRHFQPIDSESWHVMLLNGDDRILGCARYRPLRGGLEQLGAASSAIARSHRYGPVLKSGVERLIDNVRRRDKRHGEAGGWALRREIRGSTAGVTIALMTFALAEHLGSGLAFTTATRLNASSSILCRIGASRLAEFPAYYEPKYGSIIEVLHFDLPNRNPRYASKLDKLRSEILHTPIVCASGHHQSTSANNSYVPAPVTARMPELFTTQ